MSEYASSKHSKNEAPLEATIFDDALLDAMADKLGSYDEARRRLGIKAPEYVTPTLVEAEPGAFVTLDERAIAVEGILRGINLSNKASGATQKAESPVSDFSKRYENPQEVASIMRSSAKQLIAEHFDTLNATKAMVDVGFNPDFVIYSKNRIEDRAKAFEGTGKGNVSLREKEADRVRHTADF